MDLSRPAARSLRSPAIGADGTIYFTSTDGILYALKPDGTEFWRLHTGGMTESSPVLDEAGNLYLAVNKVHHFRLAGRQTTLGKGRPMLVDIGDPPAAAAGTVYFSMPYNRLMALTRRD